ncbi:endonuclease MutS2 [Corallococcus sp. H22C18031201]|uniref:endonuclease MutS2 n=1 Tax=Citreicoccus inhibens TaxID=2849499 RepID=UPI000E72A03D|nr:Smr/MutS family protein [Citreicoccus inhibens]MBU8898607.1 Smr/MutS family protein [Citreicoccus inhibens]RJS25031.1 endonuclease MutS2 [Corallococcus sp. H22C18031201]
MTVQISQRTLEDLGFADVLRALAQRCRTEPGRERALARPFLDSAEEVTEALALVAEARTLSQEQFSLPLGGVTDLRIALGHTTKGGVLEPRQLIDSAQLLLAFINSREALEDRRERVPRMMEIARQMPLLESLARRIDQCFEPDGEISDRASPALREARDRTRGLHRRIKSRLDEMLHDEGFVSKLRENYYSVRNGRYVVPVVSNYRSEVDGIVHNASQTGQTLFMEPQVMVSLGNDLAIAQSEVAEEELKVLQELSGHLGREADRILEGLAAVAELDELEAVALLSADLDANTPAFDGVRELELRLLRHPRLVLKDMDVVANDVALTGEARSLVVSGPNAGGKTVTLTGVGLCALMLRSALPIPVAEGSRMPLYRSVHSTVGDAQDLTQGLSTFSAHVVMLRDIIGVAGEGSLVLIDEIAADTDPREGAAIAVAVLEELLQKDAVVLVTTHLEELKALAHMDRRFLNARVGFDAKKMAPTYRLQIGAAGQSSAIEVAARVGLPARVCERARELSVNAGGPLTKALAAAEDERRKLNEELEKARVAAREAEALRAELEKQKVAFERERKGRMMQFNDDVHAATELATTEVRELLAKLRTSQNEKALSEARAQLQQRAEEAQKRSQAAKAELFQVEAPAPATLKVGAWVHHSGLGRDVEILELSEGSAVVSAGGAMKMRVPTTELSGSRTRKPQQARFPERAKQEAVLKRAASAAPAEVEATNFRCDVRGHRADEALTEVEAFLDAGMRQGEEAAVIIHGHGTGALKQAIRDYLAASPYIRMFRPGESHEGGDGVTIVALRS